MTEDNNVKPGAGGDLFDESTGNSTTSQGTNFDASEASSTAEEPDKESGNDLSYFARRSSVLEDRDTRWEVKVRDRVVRDEARFRLDLAEELDTNTVSKTDAREYAMLFAYQHPEQVAQMMEEDGYEAER